SSSWRGCGAVRPGVARARALAALALLLVACAAPPAAPIATPTVAPIPTPSLPSPTPAPPTPTVPPSPTPQPLPTAPPGNLSIGAIPRASWGADTAQLAIDGDPNTLWFSQNYPPQWYAVVLKQPALVSRIELVVAQTPAGETTHEVWLGLPDGSLSPYKTLAHVNSSDGQTLTVPVDPPRVITRVLLRT